MRSQWGEAVSSQNKEKVHVTHINHEKKGKSMLL